MPWMRRTLKVSSTATLNLRIFLSPTRGQAKVLDFGIAKQLRLRRAAPPWQGATEGATQEHRLP